jgi:hypothetical protein
VASKSGGGESKQQKTTMNKNNAAQFLPLVQALAEGKTIQKKLPNEGWLDMTSLTFEDDIERYRIKPDPPKPIEFDCWVADLGSCGISCTDNDMSKYGKPWRKIRVREIIEETN